uniref:Uncharacterized protein n=1 Tax=Geospiza parvula TaxID=87175 RepID=A0A8C3M656_GEOPR
MQFFLDSACLVAFTLLHWEVFTPFVFILFQLQCFGAAFQPHDFMVPGRSPLPRCYAARCFSRSEQTGNINSLQRSNVLCIFLVQEIQDSFEGVLCGLFLI